MHLPSIATRFIRFLSRLDINTCRLAYIFLPVGAVLMLAGQILRANYLAAMGALLIWPFVLLWGALAVFLVLYVAGTLLSRVLRLREKRLNDRQQEVLSELAEVWALSPDVRLGQLMAHLGFLAESHFGKGLDDIDDDELSHVVLMSRLEPPEVASPDLRRT